MKHLLILSLSFILLSTGCKKNKNEPQLPPITTTGAMTFGCKINGKVFVPRDARGKVGLIVEYTNLDGGWHLNLPATNWQSRPTEGFSIGTDSLLLVSGVTYEFKLDANYQSIKGTTYAKFANSSGGYLKLNNNNGSLFITKHDQQNRILSGTFFFTGTNLSTGDKINVTDGRFDIRY